MDISKKLNLQDCEISPEDKLAIEIYTNSEVDIKVKVNVVSDENGAPLADQEILDIAHDLLRAVLATLSENVSELTQSQLEENGADVTVSIHKATE